MIMPAMSKIKVALKNTSLGSPLLFFLLIVISLFHECEYSCPQHIMNGFISITHTFYMKDSIDVPVST